MCLRHSTFSLSRELMIIQQKTRFKLCTRDYITKCILLEILEFILWERVWFSSVQLLSLVWLFATPWTAAHQASLTITNSRSLLKPIESVMPSNHLILCRPLLLPPSIFSSLRVFWNKSALRMSLPKYWSLSFSISTSNDYSELISFRIVGVGLVKILKPWDILLIYCNYWFNKYIAPLLRLARGALSTPFWCLRQKLLCLFFTLIKFCYTNALQRSTLVPGPWSQS